MNRSFSLPVLFSLSLFALAACNDAKPPETGVKPATLDTEQQRMGYGLGASVGRQFRGDGLQVDVDALVRGVREGFSSDTLSMTEEQIGAAMQQLQEGRRAGACLARVPPPMLRLNLAGSVPWQPTQLRPEHQSRQVLPLR